MCNIRENVNNFLVKYNLKNTKEPLLVAFSGGFDSLCLLDVLIDSGMEPVAIHLNHNWRGEESRKEMLFCKEYCEKKRIPFYSETLDKNLPHTETVARKERYEFFKRAAEKFNSKCVLTAHNADDNAETVLYRVIKGTGVEGLCAIAEHRGIFFRPLLTISRNEIEAYCASHNLTPNLDSSNYDVKYKRNFIRHKIMPLLKEINKDFVNALNSLAKVAEEENGILKEYIKNLSEKIGSSTPEFAKLSLPVQNKVIYYLFKENNLDYDREKIREAVKFINENKENKSGKTLSITTDLWLFAGRQEFKFINKTIKTGTEVRINGCGKYEFDGGFLTVEECFVLPESYPDDKDCIAYIDVCNPEFTLRYRKDGDIMQPLGVPGTQKLKKYFNSKKIPNYKKDSIPLLCRENEIFWVIGYGISEKIKVENKPSYVLKFTKKEVGNGN